MRAAGHRRRAGTFPDILATVVASCSGPADGCNTYRVKPRFSDERSSRAGHAWTIDVSPAPRPSLAFGLTVCFTACLAAGCGHHRAVPEAGQPAAGQPAGASGGGGAAGGRSEVGPELGWIVGRWARPAGIEHWAQAGGVLWGVGFSVRDDKTELFEALLIEKAGGGLRYVAMPNGKREVAFPATEAGPAGAVFANPQHDFPRIIRYRREGDVLVARVEGDAPAEDYRWQLEPPGRAEALEAADRAFAADTASRGVEGWVAAFDPAGAMWNRRRQVSQAGEGIRAAMAPLFAKGVQIEWAPLASGLSPAGDLGYTVGTSRFTAPDASGARTETHRGAYVTIWRKQSDGRWKVLFDTGT
jgi:ketosteroid isomerase-like protein